MNTAEADIRNGTEATVSRGSLLLYVQSCPEAAAYYAEQARLKEMADRLRARKAAQASALRFGQMIAAKLKPRDQYVKVERIPGLTLEPGRLSLEFADRRDGAYSLALIALAEARDPEAFWKRCEPPRKPARVGELKYTLYNHPFTTHPTYTGPGCALCGRPEVAHIDLGGVLRLATPEEAARLTWDVRPVPEQAGLLG
jgi:hypothetical protein